MKNHGGYTKPRIVAVAAAIAVILSACATMPVAPPGSAELRGKLTALKSDPSLASRAPVALEQAESAVALAETRQPDPELAAHRVFMADRMIDTARATAETRLAEAQRADIKQQSDQDRLTARTREADAANSAAATARTEAETARNATAAAATAAALSETQRQELSRQIALLQGRTTERGIVLTLGDVLFATGSASLKAGHIDNLDRLAAFMTLYTDRTASIEGHTDSIGADAYNQDLSMRRADSVRAYLDNHGISSGRLTSVGKGEAEPVAGNESAAGRQQNRRVEVIIRNDLVPVAAVR